MTEHLPLAALGSGPSTHRSPAAWCAAASEVVGASGAGVMLISGDVMRGSLCATDPVSARLEDLQYTLGEGPCIDAYHSGDVIGEADLEDRACRSRWPAFTAGAVEVGARALFAFPVQVGSVRLGALDFYRSEPGRLTDAEHAAGLVLAEVLARWVLDLQSTAPEGAVPAILEQYADFHYAVHGAAGAVSVQAGVSVAEAQILLRAYAFSTNQSVNDVAAAVLARKIRFGGDGSVATEPGNSQRREDADDDA